MKHILPLSTVLCLLTMPGIAQGAVHLGPRSVQFTTEDGLTIHGTLFGIPKLATHTVILSHMYKHDRTTWMPLMAPLANAGIASLAIDLRGHGESAKQQEGDLTHLVEAREASLFLSMHLDIRAAMDYLEKTEESKNTAFILGGASVGCSVSIHAAARYPHRVSAVFLMTPGSRYLGMPTMEHLQAFPDIPVLILSAKEEAGLGATAIRDALASRNNIALQLFPETRIHGTGMFGKVEGVDHRIVQWCRNIPPARHREK